MDNTVTVIVPTYNGRSRGFLTKALSSILTQTRPAEEVIIVDDGSSDDTAQFIKENYPQFTLISQKNAGPSAARNLAMRHTSGSFIAFLDDDDEWEPAKIERQLAFLLANPTAGFAGCGMIYIDETSQAVGRELPTAWGCQYPESILGNGFLPPSTLMFRKSLLDRVGEWNTELRMGEDYELCFRCTKLSPFAIQMEYLTRYRRHGHQSCNSLAKIDDQTLKIVEGLADREFPARRERILRYYAYGAAWRAVLRRDFVYGLSILRYRGLKLHLLELGVRFCGIALAPLPGLKRRWRQWEAKRVLA